MDTLRYKAVFLFWAVLAFPYPLFGLEPNLTVLSSSDQGFHFVYSFQSELNLASESGARITAQTMSRTLQVAVPPGCGAELVSVLGRTDYPSDVVGEADLDEAVPPLAQLSRPTLIRGRRSVGVRVQPVAYGAVYEQVEVQIGFSRARVAASLTRPEDPAFERIWAASLANYEVARNWPIEDLRRSTALSAGATANTLTAADRWFKVRVSQTGLTRLTGAQLQAAGVPLGNLSSDSVRVFNAGGLPNSVNNADPRPEFTEVSLMVLDGGDGLIGPNDQILFYGEAPSRWVYPAENTPKYVNNPYTDENMYWLAVSGSFSGPSRRMAEVDGSPSGGSVPLIDTYTDRIHVEQDNLLSMEADGHVWDFYHWYWTDQPGLTLQVATPGAVESDSAYIYTGAKTNRSVALAVNGVTAYRIDCHTSACQHYTYSLLGGTGATNRLDLQLAPLTGSIPPFLDYVEIYCPSRLLPVNDEIDFALEDVAGQVDVSVIDAFSSTPLLFDISDPLDPTVITGFQRAGGFLVFRTETSLDSPNRYYSVTPGRAGTPVGIQETTLTDLRTGYAQTDMIVIAAESLAPYLGEYVGYREAQGVTIQLVTVKDIIDNFSYGLYDPTAIRDFLKFAYENYPDPAPSAAFFVGDASFDFLDHLATGMPNYVPSYVRPADRTYSDDNYVYFGDYGILDSDYDRGFDMMTARWAVRSASEISTIMQKIRAYESPSGFGSWRTRVTLVADDEHTRDRDNETFHTTQTETLEKEHLPRIFNRQKIYLWEYPFVNRSKPAVNDAIVDAFNDGALVVNYVGHGNPDVWSHEHVLQRTADLPRMHNDDRLPLVYTASCDIGFFDDPVREGMAEDFLAMPGGGAIGVISATRLVYAADNAQFNRVVFDNLFGSPELSISEALFAAKLQRQYPNPLDTIPRPVENDRAYILLGDPCLKLGIPGYRVEFTQRPDSLRALEVSRLSGRVVDPYGAPYHGSGLLDVTVCDSERERSFHLPDDTNAIRYAVAGPTLFRGTATVVDGVFDLQFMTPLDIGYRGASARVSVYGILAGVDAIGLVDSIPVSEVQSTAQDSDGPAIEYASVRRGVIQDGDFLESGDSLVIRLVDPSGINLAGSIGHGISVVVDDDVESAVSLTDRFEYDRDGYTSGGLTWPLDGIGAGRHRIKIKAWDNVNNVAVVEFVVVIGDDAQLVLRELLNYPNPMTESTSFYFELSQAVDELIIEVYTLSGKNIWSTRRHDLRADRYPNGAIEITWDGRDHEGDRVGSGVYIYRVTVSGGSDGGGAEELGKLVVLN